MYFLDSRCCFSFLLFNKNIAITTAILQLCFCYKPDIRGGWGPSVPKKKFPSVRRQNLKIFETRWELERGFSLFILSCSSIACNWARVCFCQEKRCHIEYRFWGIMAIILSFSWLSEILLPFGSRKGNLGKNPSQHTALSHWPVAPYSFLHSFLICQTTLRTMTQSDSNPVYQELLMLFLTASGLTSCSIFCYPQAGRVCGSVFWLSFVCLANVAQLAQTFLTSWPFSCISSQIQRRPE